MKQMLQDFSLDEVKVNDVYIKNALEKELSYLKALMQTDWQQSF